MPTLEITTMVGCPLMCSYCPQDKIKAAHHGQRYLTLENFITILGKIPDYVRIDFSGMAEPWANPQCTDMLRHTLASGFNVAIYTTLVGMKDPDDVIEILRHHYMQIETVVLHLPDDRGNMRGFKWTPEYQRALDAFLGFRDEGALRELSVMAMGGSDVADLMPWQGNNRAGSLDLAAIGDQPVESVWDDGPVSCSFTPFYDQNVLLPNGDVVLCCMDYGAKHRLGNLLTGDYFSLFASDAMRALQVENMKCGDGTICKSCDRATRYKVHDFKQFWNPVVQPV